MELFQKTQTRLVFCQIKTKKGFSLVEVLVFAAILSMFFASVAGIAANSLRALSSDRHKIYATRYAEEVLEWLQDQKDQDWTTFTGRQGSYCFSESPITDWPSQGACTAFSLNATYKRNVVLTLDPTSTQMNVSITVSWQEVNQVQSVPINTIFAIWEK